jgi:hypothetical protein
MATPDANALATMNGDNAQVPQTMAGMDGKYTPAENKLYTERMNITYGVGFGAELGVPVGSLVLGKKDVVALPKQEIIAIIVSAHGFWREWKKYEAGNPAKDFLSEGAAIAAGFRTVNPPYGSGLPLANCSPAVNLNLLVQAPKGGTSSMAFNILLGGDLYAAVTFTVDRTNYREIEQVLNNLPKLDAASRGRPMHEGRTTAFFVKLSTRPEVKQAKVAAGEQPRSITVVHLNLSPLLGSDSKLVRVGDAVRDDLAMLASQLAAPTTPEPDQLTTDQPF